MCNKKCGPRQNAQRGISLILVLFLLVVVSLLAAAMAKLNSGGSAAVGLEIQSTRALFAAESGAQIMAMKTFPISSATSPTACNVASFSQSFTVNGLNGCTANVACASTPTTVGARTIYVFTVTSEGICGNGVDRARRNIRVMLRSG